MVDEILFRAAAGALILAAMLGPLGSFVVWRRMAYLGDTIAHASLLGVALSLLLGAALPMTLGVFLVAAAVAVVLARFTHDTRFHTDTLLGILSHGALALGLVLVALQRDVRVDVEAYLFGDILVIDWADVGLLALLALVVLAVIVARWRKLLMTTLHPALAQVEGVQPSREQLILTLLLSAVIAVSIKLTGILLITALLVIPAATARLFACSPQQMALLAALAGMLSTSSGLAAAYALDAPASPMMVVMVVVGFVVGSLVKRR